MKRCKKIVRGLFFKENGSVSIYAMIIILPVFILNALLIDTMRILVSERQLEQAMESALRSTMAEFNSNLSEVGLFAYGGNDASGKFQSYLNKNIYSTSELSGYQNLATPIVESASAGLDSTRNLVDVDVMKVQVLESMKYQAPIQVGVDLLDLLIGNHVTKEEIEKAENLVENYEEIFNLMKKRNEKIDKSNALVKDIEAIIKETIPNKIVGKELTGEFDKIPTNLSTLYQIAAYNPRYIELKEKEKDPDEELSKDEKDELSNYRAAISVQAINKIKNLFTIETYSDGAINHLIGTGSLENPTSKSAKDFNNQINAIFDEGESLESLQELKLEDTYFKVHVEKLDEIYEELHVSKGSGETLWDVTNLNQYSIGELVTSFYLLIELGETYTAERTAQAIKEKAKTIETEMLKKIGEENKKYEKMKKEINSLELEEAEDEADESFGDLWKKVNEMVNVASMIQEDNATYAEIEGYIAQYNGATGGQLTVEEEGDRMKFIKDAFNRFKEFIEFVGNFPESVRDEMYINEYILANYGSKGPYGLEQASSYSYDTKKAHYITYGYPVAGANYLRFLMDVLMILFIVNLITEMAYGGFAGFVGFFKALAKAFITSITELIELTNSEKGFLNWSPFKVFGKAKKVKMTPVMFLRILMGMRSTGTTYNNEKMRRLQGVVTKETGVNLLTTPSYLEANVTGKVKLWFIPKLADVLPGDVRGNYYYYEKKKVYSY